MTSPTALAASEEHQLAPLLSGRCRCASRRLDTETGPSASLEAG